MNAKLADEKASPFPSEADVTSEVRLEVQSQFQEITLSLNNS